MKVNIIRIVEPFLLHAALSRDDPRIGNLNLIHGLEDLLADTGTDLLNQQSIISGRLFPNFKPPVKLLQQIDHLLGMHVN